LQSSSTSPYRIEIQPPRLWTRWPTLSFSPKFAFVPKSIQRSIFVDRDWIDAFSFWTQSDGDLTVYLKKVISSARALLRDATERSAWM
jgi:hypothetical protein